MTVLVTGAAGFIGFHLSTRLLQRGTAMLGLDNVNPYYANVLDSLQGKAEALCEGREGLRILELLIGAYRSTRDGRTVHLPLEY
jgi:nucleoside-diphosphate-sugar epimerase